MSEETETSLKISCAIAPLIAQYCKSLENRPTLLRRAQDAAQLLKETHQMLLENK